MRSVPAPAMKSNANSSRSYWVTRPDGITRQVRPSAVIVRVGMSGQLHFAIDAGRIDRRVRCRGVGAGQRFRVGRLDEFQKCPRQTRLLENPEVTLEFGIVLLLPLH